MVLDLLSKLDFSIITSFDTSGKSSIFYQLTVHLCVLFDCTVNKTKFINSRVGYQIQNYLSISFNKHNGENKDVNHKNIIIM